MTSEPVKKLAQELVKRKLGVPAVFVLESMKPFSVVAQQTLIATSPLASLIGYKPLFGQLTELFQDRQNVEELMLEVERLMEENRG